MQAKIKEFINILFSENDYINISKIHDLEKGQQAKNKIIQAKNFPEILETNQYGTFICPNPMLAGSKKRLEKNIEKINWLFIDFDNLEIDIEALPVRPNLICRRGKKHTHLYFKIKDALNEKINIEKYQLICDYFIKHFKADKQVKNPAGLIRLPYTIRYKDDKKEFYTFEKMHNEALTLDEFLKILNLTHNVESVPVNFDISNYVYERNKKLFENKKIEVGQGRSRKLLLLGFECFAWGIEKEKALETAFKLNQEIFDYPEKDYIVRHQINSAYKYSKVEFGSRQKEYQENQTIKTKNKYLVDCEKFEQIRDKLKDYGFCTQIGWLFHKHKNERYTRKEDIGYFLNSKSIDKGLNVILIKGLIDIYDKVDFLPALSKNEFVDEEGYKIYNFWQGVHFEKYNYIDEHDNEGTEIFLKHIKYLTTSEYEYKTLLSYIAHNVQKPGVKIPWAPVLINKNTGTGRTFLTRLFSLFYGQNSGGVTHNVIRTGYTSYMVNMTTLFINEIKDSDNYNFMESFKEFIDTENKNYLNEKWSKGFFFTPVVNFFFFSNHIDAIKIDVKDRRTFVVYSNKEPLTQIYYNELYSILKDNKKLSSVYDFLKNYDLSDFDIYKRPESTKGKALMIATTTGEVQLYLDELQNDCEIFKLSGLRVRDLQRYIEQFGSEIIKRKISEKQIKIYLINNGFTEFDFFRKIGDKRMHFRLWSKSLDAKDISSADLIKIYNLENTENMDTNKKIF